MSLKLNGNLFDLNTETRDTAFFLWEEDEGIEISIECTYKRNLFNEDEVTTGIVINPLQTHLKSQQALVGYKFEVKTIEEADEREDTFYMYEHEPLERYVLTIIGFKDDYAHVHIEGVAIIDGYSNPYVAVPFELEEWLPIVTNVNDWEKFNL